MAGGMAALLRRLCETSNESIPLLLPSREKVDAKRTDEGAVDAPPSNRSGCAA